MLVVDDSRVAADSLETLLRLHGHDARAVHDGAAALAAAQEFCPDAVFLDLGMPGLSGYEVARRLRQRPDFRGVLLVALTGWGQEEDRQRSCAAGFDHHLTKPADPEVLLGLLAERS